MNATSDPALYRSKIIAVSFRRRMQNVVIVTSVVLGFSIIVIRKELIAVLTGVPLRYVESEFPRTLFAVAATGMLLILLGFAVTLLAYLRGDLLSTPANSEGDAFGIDHGSMLRTLTARIDALEQRVEASTIQQTGLQPEDRQRLLESVQGDLVTHLKQTLPEQLRNELASDAANRESLDRGIRVIAAARLRLERELSALTRRGNLNLVIGSLTTCAAVVLLYQTVAGVSTKFESLEALLSFYIPRVSTAVFVEMFSFFFLRLYRNGLMDMKYYHGELLRLDTRMAILDTALARGTQSTQSEILKLIADTHRATDSADSSPEERTVVDTKAISELVSSALKVAKSGN